MKKKSFVFVRGNFFKKKNNPPEEFISKDRLVYVNQAKLEIIGTFDKYNLSTAEVRFILDDMQDIAIQKESIDSLKDIKKTNKEKISIFMNSIISSFSTEKFSYQIEDIYNKTKGKKIIGWAGMLSPYIQSYDN